MANLAELTAELDDIEAAMNALPSPPPSSESCARVCEIASIAKDAAYESNPPDQEWLDLFERACSLYQQHCKGTYGDCGACELA